MVRFWPYYLFWPLRSVESVHHRTIVLQHRVNATRHEMSTPSELMVTAALGADAGAPLARAGAGDDGATPGGSGSAAPPALTPVRSQRARRAAPPLVALTTQTFNPHPPRAPRPRRSPRGPRASTRRTR